MTTAVTTVSTTTAINIVSGRASPSSSVAAMPFGCLSG
jgi:hypothetical protein